MVCAVLRAVPLVYSINYKRKKNKGLTLEADLAHLDHLQAGCLVDSAPEESCDKLVSVLGSIGKRGGGLAI